MICPECAAENQQRAMCSRCGAALGDGEEIAAEGEWARLVELSSEAEAQIIQGYLESSGVPCQVESLFFRAEPLTFGPLARVRLHVLRGHLEAAQRLLREAQEADARIAEEQAESDPDNTDDPAARSRAPGTGA